jgi:GNAT superfamily N-acetyltransferase
MKFRPALPDDRTFVISATRGLASFGPPAWQPQEDIVKGETRTLEAFFAGHPLGSVLLVAESEESSRLGFVYLERLQDYFTLEQHGHVGMLVVMEKAEGNGVGSALVRAAEAWAREEGYRKITLGVFETNRRARTVYEHLGYAPETLRYVKIL